MKKPPSAQTNDYEVLIDDQRSPADSIAQRREAARLEEIAQNLASLGRLVDAEARGRETITEAVPAEGTPGGTLK